MFSAFVIAANKWSISVVFAFQYHLTTMTVKKVGHRFNQ